MFLVEQLTKSKITFKFGLLSDFKRLEWLQIKHSFYRLKDFSLGSFISGISKIENLLTPQAQEGYRNKDAGFVWFSFRFPASFII